MKMDNENFNTENRIKGQTLLLEADRIAKKILKINGMPNAKPMLTNFVVREAIQSIVHKTGGLIKITSDGVLSEHDSGKVFEEMLGTTIATYASIAFFSVSNKDVSTDDESLVILGEICVTMYNEFADVCFSLLK